MKILFEECFFNPNDESYQVLCLDQPLEGGEYTGLLGEVSTLVSWGGGGGEYTGLLGEVSTLVSWGR